MRRIVIALTAVIALAGAGIAGAGESSADAAAKETAHTAQVVAETYAIDHGGSYAGLTLKKMRSYESTLPIAPGRGMAYVSRVVATSKSYTVTATSTTKHTFAISRRATGSIIQTCAPKGTSSCSAKGTWQ